MVKRFNLLTITFGLYLINFGFIASGMEQAGAAQVPVAALGQAGYDSDSEDERDYQYQGMPQVRLPNDPVKRYLFVSRGIHFSPTYIEKQKRSQMCKTDEAGMPIYPSAAYDIAGQPLGSSDAPELLHQAGLQIRHIISSLPEKKRHMFQEIYSNNYDGFHNRLARPCAQGIFNQFTSQKNPQVSTSEYCPHSARYAAGVKFLGAGVKHLDPEYDGQGKPKHPYLGKLYVILIDEQRIGELSPYFVVWGHANNLIKVSDHFRKNVLVEREVSFPGFIPGECVVLSIPLRVPSFTGDYKPWYQDKYGLTSRVFNNKKKMIAGIAIKKGDKRTADELKTAGVQDLLEKYIVPHLAEKLFSHVRDECQKKGITLIFKKTTDGFGESLPDLVNARSQRDLIIKRAVAVPAPVPQIVDSEERKQDRKKVVLKKLTE